MNKIINNIEITISENSE